MNETDKKTKLIILKTLSPVHVGSGEKLNKSGYIFNRETGELNILDEFKWYEYLDRKGKLDTYQKYILDSVSSSQNPPKNRLDNADWMKREGLRFTETEKKEAVKYSYRIKGPADKALNDISLCIKDIYGQPYIPGSSIKGAVRTALICAGIITQRGRYASTINQLRTILEKKSPQPRAKSEIIRLLGQIDSKNDYYNISISDSKTRKDNISVTICRDVDYNYKKRVERTMPSYREYISAGTEHKVLLAVTADIYKKVEEADKPLIRDFSHLKELIKTYNEYIFDRNYIFGISADTKRYLPATGEAPVIILGGNTGYHQKTILTALLENKDELVEATKNILHKEPFDPTKKAITGHMFDKLVSPRVLNLADTGEARIAAGFAELQI